jgi:Major Facilitator Superfamily
MLTSSLHSHTANTGPLDSLDTQNSGTVDNEVVGDASESDPDVEKNTVDDAWGDPNLVGWNGPNDAENPKNWSFGRKWGAIAIVSAFTFISPVSSSMVAPALPILKAQFHITNSVESQIFMSIFVLAYAVGPLALGPLSEIYGRAPVLQLANLWFLVFNTACGAAKNTASMAVFRFLAGLGGSAPLSVRKASCQFPCRMYF